MIRFQTPDGLQPAVAVDKVKAALVEALGPVTFQRADVVGPKVSGELFQSGILALGLAIGLMLLVIIVAAMTRRTEEIGSVGVEHERTRLLTGSLVATQLRNLWRRRRPNPHHRIDLSTPPRDARDAMVHLQELARRHDLARDEVESADDFTTRLAGPWDGAGDSLDELRACYEHARYSTPTPEDDAAAVEAWGRVHTVVRELDERAEQTSQT